MVGVFNVQRVCRMSQVCDRPMLYPGESLVSAGGDDRVRLIPPIVVLSHLFSVLVW